MKFGYQFSNLCGTVYKKGNITFTPDGNTLLSPVGNRITAFDLVNNTSVTFPFENRQRIQTIGISPDSSILMSIDEEGHTLLINYYRRVVLSRFNFKEKVKVLSFSKDSKYFAVGVGRFVQIWNTPGLQREFAPFLMVRKFTNHFDDVTCIDWSTDNEYVLSGSKDLSLRINSLHDKNFLPITLSGHKDSIIGCFFGKSNKEIYSITRDGALFHWEFIPDEESIDKQSSDISVKAGKWKLKAKHFFLQNSKVSSCSIHHHTGTLLVVGFNNGVFGLYDLPEFTTIHTLSISHKKITSCSISKTGEWLGFACADFGQLLVWEWKSETYVMKQQGHALDMNCLCYSPDGQLIATGADDGKIKVWNTSTGFCFVTFTEHTGTISSIAFTPNGNAIISSSYDGTVRAFDLIRYRNFRTMTSPNPTSFSALAVDPSGDIICSASRDSFEIFIWSLQTGRLLDILGGHEGPVTSLCFNPLQPVLASASWDKTIKLWEIYESKPAKESLVHGTEVLGIAFRPDGKELCSSTLDGQLHFWDVENASVNGLIEGKKDIMGGRKSSDARTAKNNTDTKHFTSVCYSADGNCVIAGGKSKFICMYEISQRILLKKFQISYNRSLDGVLDFLNSKNITDAGPMDQIDDLEEDNRGARIPLPGVQKGDLSKRSTKPVILTKGVMFSPTNRSWAAVTTEGLLVYSLDDQLIFDPFELDMDITTQSIMETLKTRQYLKSLVMSFRLNEQEVIKKIYESIPSSEIQVVVNGFPATYIQKLLTFISTQVEKSPHLEFHLIWLMHLFNHHGLYLKDNSGQFLSVLRNIQKNVSGQQQDIAKISDDNMYALEYLSEMSKYHPKPQPEEEEMEVSKKEEETEEIPLEKKNKGKKRKASKK